MSRSTSVRRVAGAEALADVVQLKKRHGPPPFARAAARAIRGSGGRSAGKFEQRGARSARRRSSAGRAGTRRRRSSRIDRMMCSEMPALYSCHRNPPTPGRPVSISAATITSHAMPRLRRKPVNMYGSVAGSRILNSVFGRSRAQHLGDVQVVLRDRPHADGRVQHRRPHRADGDREQRRPLRARPASGTTAAPR